MEIIIMIKIKAKGKVKFNGEEKDYRKLLILNYNIWSQLRKEFPSIVKIVKDLLTLFLEVKY
jgi:hypothetical protein